MIELLFVDGLGLGRVCSGAIWTKIILKEWGKINLRRYKVYRKEIWERLINKDRGNC